MGRVRRGILSKHRESFKPATVSLATVFAKQGLRIDSVREVSLTHTTGTSRVPFRADDPSMSVTLRPMELHTFFVTFK